MALSLHIAVYAPRAAAVQQVDGVAPPRCRTAIVFMEFES